MDKNILQITHEETFFVKIARSLNIKPQYLALQADVYLFITYTLIILNQLELILWFYIIIMNLYWLIIVILVFHKKGKEELVLRLS